MSNEPNETEKNLAMQIAISLDYASDAFGFCQHDKVAAHIAPILAAHRPADEGESEMTDKERADRLEGMVDRMASRLAEYATIEHELMLLRKVESAAKTMLEAWYDDAIAPEIVELRAALAAHDAAKES